ncbi:Athe_2463 domain-containing protein, partial [Bacillus cereus group sp. BfR-BA-01318]
MKLNRNFVLGVGGALGLLELMNPMQAYAFDNLDNITNEVLEPVWSNVPEHLRGKIKPPIMKFTDKDRYRKEWYESRGANLLFRTNYNGITYYSPVPPKQLEHMTSMRSYYNVLENYADRNINGGYSERYDRSYPNFKTKSTVLNQTNRESLRAANYYNEYGEYRGVSGEWRYLGYTQYGNSVENPYFPADIFSEATPATYQWDLHPYNLGSKWLPEGPSPWDKEDMENLYPKKIQAIKRLLDQEPSMKYKNP